MRHGGLVRGHGLFGRSVAKRTCSRRHRSLQLQGDHHVRLQRRGTARWDHPGTCATADKQAVSVRGERGRREWTPMGRAWRTGPSESGVLRDRKKRSTKSASNLQQQQQQANTIKHTARVSRSSRGYLRAAARPNCLAKAYLAIDITWVISGSMTNRTKRKSSAIEQPHPPALPQLL